MSFGVPKLIGLFVEVAGTAAKRAANGWPAALAVLLYAVVMLAAGMLLGPLKTVGGFIIGIIEAACISNYLHLLSVVVGGTKLGWVDLKAGFFALLWDVIGVLFVLWVASFGVDLLQQAAGDHGEAITAGYGLLVAIFLNPVPELIYQRRSAGRTTDLLLASARFVQEHWIEWFLPNLLFGIALLALVVGIHGLDAKTLMVTLPGLFTLQGAYRLAPALLAVPGAVWVAPLVLALCHYAMVFRGVLFKEIQGGGWRARAFRSAFR
jgi:hypothetical protein